MSKGQIRKNVSVTWNRVKGTQPVQPTNQTKKWKSGITFERVIQFGWNFATKLLKDIDINDVKTSLVGEFFFKPPNQPKMELIENFWKLMKFQIFSMKHLYINWMNNNLDKYASYIDFIAPISVILFKFVYKIYVFKLNLHEKWT